MGIGGISMGSLLLILLIVLLLFGTKRLRSIGTDLGQALKSFRQGLQDTSTLEKASDTLHGTTPSAAPAPEKPTLDAESDHTHTNAR